MRDLPHVIGERRAIPDAKGNWTPLPAYSGWAPVQREPLNRGWWLVIGGTLLVFAAIRAGL